jgi:hypothetical protein
VLQDLTDADCGADGRATVVVGFPFVAGEDGHGDLPGGVEGAFHELDVAGLKDVKGENLLRKEGDLVQREERERLAKVHGNGSFLGHE